MSDKAWKRREREAAGFFGAQRQVLSGSSGRSDRGQSDSTHEYLYIETKLRQTHSARTLHDDAAKKARKEGKAPVLMLSDAGRPGFLVCVHTANLDALVAERLAHLVRTHAFPASEEVRDLIIKLRDGVEP